MGQMSTQELILLKSRSPGNQNNRNQSWEAKQQKSVLRTETTEIWSWEPKPQKFGPGNRNNRNLVLGTETTEIFGPENQNNRNLVLGTETTEIWSLEPKQ